MQICSSYTLIWTGRFVGQILEKFVKQEEAGNVEENKTLSEATV